jgi:hypothetical protein
MSFAKQYPQYATIESRIRVERLERTVAVAEAISQFVVDCWSALREPAPPPAITPIDRRRAVRHDMPRAIVAFPHH